MAQVVKRERSYPSEALRALFGRPERWGWSLEIPETYSPSPLRCSPPVPHVGEDYAATYQSWREQIERDEEALMARSAIPATWLARRPAEQYKMAAIFGGTTTGWHALLTTLGGSMLGSGASLTVVNLSERAVAGSLRALARLCGYRTRIDTVAPEKCSFDIFAYAGPQQLIDFVVEVVHSDEQEANGDAREDRDVLRKVASALQGALTCERLQVGLRVLLREAGPPKPGDAINAEEYQAVASLLGEQRRQYTDVVARAARLEHALSDFAALERSSRLAAPESSREPEDLRIIEAWRTPSRLDFDFSVKLLVEAVMQRITRLTNLGQGREVFVIVGADRLNRRLLQSFSDLADGRGATLVLLFAHLRDDALDALGAASAAVAFMRLTDHREAQQAASFIGSEYKFVVSQTTRTRSQSYEQAGGRQVGNERGRSDSRGPEFSRTIGQSVGHSESTSFNVSHGESFTASESDQRVHEPKAEPEVLQALPETGVLLVGLPSRIPVFADCDPTIVTLRTAR
jgi:hypothetical protein